MKIRLLIPTVQVVVLPLAIGAVLATTAFADNGTPPPPPPPPPPIGVVPGACKQDIQTFCPDAKPGDGRIATCIRTYYRALSPACKEAIRENRRERVQPPPPPPPTSPPPASPPTASPPASH